MSADLTNASTQAPAATPVAAVEPSTPAAAEVPAFAQTLDHSHFAAKLSAFRSATAAPAADPAAASASETPAPAPAATTPAPASTSSPEGAQAPQQAPGETPTQFLERLARTENERDSLAKQIAELSPKAKSATEIEAALAADPIKFLVDRGVTQEALRDFLLNGPKKPDPALVAAETAAKQALEKAQALEAAAQEREVAANVAAYKAREVAPVVVAEKYPLLLAVHGATAVEQVYALMNNAYQAGQNVSAEQAAAHLEGMLAGLQTRMSGGTKPAPAAAVAPPAAPKQALRDLTNGSSGAEISAPPTGHYDPSQDDARIARAAELMRRRREAG
jgi:hypothetical protein